MPKKYVTFIYLLVGLFIFTGCGQGAVQSSAEIDDIDFEEHTPDDTTDAVIENSDNKEAIKDASETLVQEILSLSKMKVHFIDVGQADSTLI